MIMLNVPRSSYGMAYMIMSRDREVIAKMAALLRQGATMLDATCPNCNVPLFRLKSGEIICPKCGQRFLLVSSDEEELEAKTQITLQGLEAILSKKINELGLLLDAAENMDDISTIGGALETLLTLMEKSRRLRMINSIEEGGDGKD